MSWFLKLGKLVFVLASFSLSATATSHAGCDGCITCLGNTDQRLAELCCPEDEAVANLCEACIICLFCCCGAGIQTPRPCIQCAGYSLQGCRDLVSPNPNAQRFSDNRRINMGNSAFVSDLNRKAIPAPQHQEMEPIQEAHLVPAAQAEEAEAAQ